MSKTKYTPLIDRPHPASMGGTQQVYRFANGYGASVVRFHGSYGSEEGLYELGVLKFDGDDWRLTYETSITDDVIGFLSPADVDQKLDEIEALAAAKATA